MTVELFGTASCPHTAEAREDLDWRGVEFVEHDVDRDPEAMARMLALTGGRAAVPVLVEDGAVTRVGWQGRTCPVTVPPGVAWPPGCGPGAPERS